MSAPDLKTLGAQAARIGLDVATGDRSDGVQAAKELMELIIAMVPVDELKQFLTETDRAWADAAADIAERVKLGAP